MQSFKIEKKLDNIGLQNLVKITKEHHAVLVAVSKTHPATAIKDIYDQGILDFGENKVQELLEKQPVLPQDIRWHLIGHLQSNKVKYIAPFVYMIHSADSAKLINTIHEQAIKNGRVINILLQVHIASESTKFGFSKEELMSFLSVGQWKTLQGIRIRGLMGMATFTEDEEQIRREFRGLKLLFDEIKHQYFVKDGLENFDTLSMGMSGDYMIALEEGSNMIRVGSLIFGHRQYNK